MNSRGQALAITAAALLVLLALAGLAADGGFYLEGRRRAQTAADAAAMAGAVSIWKDPTPAISAAAKNSASLNGFTDGTNGVTVTINSPPLHGYYAGKAKFVEAIVSHQMSTLFLGAVGYHTMTPQARAVAGPVSNPECLCTLGTTGTDVTLSGSASLDAGGCAVVVNSDSSGSISTSGSASLTAESITTVASGVSCNCTPAPQQGSACVDPLAGLKPSVGPCDFTGWHNDAPTLDPGVYCGGITVSGGYSVTFNPGTYILVDGKFNISASNASGTGVAFYLKSSVNGSCKNSQVVISSGSSVVNLSAPTTGALTGVLFLQDPNTGTGCQNTVSGGANTTLDGLMDFPTNKLTFSGGSSSAGTCTQIVSKTITFSGPSALNNDCSAYQSGTTSSVALAE